MIKLLNDNAKLYIPDGEEPEKALARTTHLAVGAHQDDLEIMAVDGILECFQKRSQWFTGVIVTDGGGSPRKGVYADYSNQQMMQVRVKEQKKAAQIGEYAAQMFLGYPSKALKSGINNEPIDDLKSVISATSPEVIYTHNLADKHKTHIGVAVHVVEALREMDPHERPNRLYGVEIWRSLDWLLDDEKTVFDCSRKKNLQEALLGVFDSQISGGKRYDRATMGRRDANATYFASHETDEATGLTYAMDLTPLLKNEGLDIATYVRGFIERFADEVAGSILSVI